MQHYGYWLLAGWLCMGVIAYAQEQKSEDYVGAVTAYLQQETGKAPQPQEIVDALNRLVIGILKKGDYRTGDTVAEQTYQFAEKVLGPDHPNTLTSVNNLGASYQAQGRYREAEPLFQRALAASEKVLGPDHPDTLTSFNNLAALYQAQGRYGEAESLYQRALVGREKALGPDHRDTLGTINNLASLYRVQGRYGEAELHYRRALTGYEKVPDPEHSDILPIVNNLAELYRTQGRYEEAEPLYQRALAAREKTLGPNHPATLTIVNNLTLLYHVQGRYGEAEPLYQRALAASENVRGPNHPATLTSVNNLAALYDSQGRYMEAEPLYQRVLATFEKVLGPEHPDTLRAQLNYTFTLANLKQPKRALQMLQRMEPHLLELAALQLRHTRQESVRRLFLRSQTQAEFQDVVLTLALSHPELDYFDLAAKVMLRWKQIQGEEEAFLARLVRRRSEKDTEIRELAKQIADLRRDLSHLANLPEPNADLQRKKLNELEAKEIRLARISHEFERHLQVRGANVGDVRQRLPRDSGALLELRLYFPVDFKTKKLDEPHWAALLLPSVGEISLYDLGPAVQAKELAQKLRETHAHADAAALYNYLFGTLDDKLKRYDPLYIAPDGFLSLLAFAELVTPDGRYWIQRQTLRQVSTGRHLISSENRDSIRLKGLLAFGEVDYERFSSDVEPIVLKEKRVQTEQSPSDAKRALRQGINQ